MPPIQNMSLNKKLNILLFVTLSQKNSDPLRIGVFYDCPSGKVSNGENRIISRLAVNFM